MFFSKRPIDTAAAIDLGSNSFHMIVARIENGQIHVQDKLKEMVRLGGGLDAEGNLTPEAQERALDCLHRFGERIRGLPPHAVRAVGTNTLRKARNRHVFLPLAETALGHRIEIVAGREEARLIHLGVAHSMPKIDGRRLVMDIGGGSTEYIIGQGFEAEVMESLHMGCVSFSRRYFRNGRIDEENWLAARIAAQRELEAIRHTYRAIGWNEAVGASGTLLSVARVLREQGWGEEGITRKGLKKLRKAMIEAGHVDRLVLKGLSEQRAPVFPGGVAIVEATLMELDIELMKVSDGALREGLIYDLIGRGEPESIRGRTVQTLARRLQVDEEQARRVATFAERLFQGVAEDWGLEQEDLELLQWSASLHEVGRVIAHSQYHKHGHYLLAHADMPGFSLQDQQSLALLVRAHRRKFPARLFAELPPEEARRLERLALLLRLSVLLHRSREDREIPLQGIRGQEAGLKISFDEEWLEAHQLTRTDLLAERALLEAAGLQLKVKGA
ncbi:MAG: exopolyphosphatase [Gammaproteobacteria bacterium]|nr:MAG: exopolyphosphatase [Gammaproteobacteria bacterium]